VANSSFSPASWIFFSAFSVLLFPFDVAQVLLRSIAPISPRPSSLVCNRPHPHEHRIPGLQGIPPRATCFPPSWNDPRELVPPPGFASALCPSSCSLVTSPRYRCVQSPQSPRGPAH